MENALKLSVIIITKNEAEMIADCLKSCKLLIDCEFLVIDDGSTDKTIEIAQQMGAKVYLHDKKDFSELRNFGASKATSEWLLYIDADERLSANLAKELNSVISQLSEFGSYKLRRVNFYLGKRWPYEEKIVRLFKKQSFIEWYGTLHETARTTGNTGEFTGELWHYTHRTLSEMVKNTLVWSTIEADLRNQAHHPLISWWRLPRVMIPVFFDYYLKQGGWRVGTVGLIESIYQAFSIFITYAKLWEIQNKNKIINI